MKYENIGENNRNTTITIGTTATKICERLPLGIRKVLVIGNQSLAGQIATLGIGGAVAANNGINVLVGGKWVESIDSRFEPTNEEIWAIGTAADTILTIYERLAVV